MYNKFFAKLIVIAFAFNIFCVPRSFASTEAKEIQSNEVKQFFADQKTIKVVFLFTSWCKHCKIGYMKLQEIAKLYDVSKLQILAISLDEEKPALVKFLKEYNKDLPNVSVYHTTEPRKIISEMNEMNLKYQGSIPHVAVFKKDGKIAIDGQFNGEYLAALIESLINP